MGDPEIKIEDRGIKTGHRNFNTKYNKIKGYPYAKWTIRVYKNVKGV
jgi:hypothetical protein